MKALMILGGEFFRLPNDLQHPIWKYPLYSFAFHGYAYERLFEDEFKGLKFSKSGWDWDIFYQWRAGPERVMADRHEVF